MFNSYIFIAAAAIVAVVLLYVIKFACILGYGVSADSAIWGQFGDFMGGSLNPILSFISIVLLIKSLNLQNQVNVELREELADNKKTERLRAFSNVFFSMVTSQKSLLESFSVNFFVDKGPISPGVSTIIQLEEEIEALRDGGSSDADIIQYIDEIDVNDRIFSLLRAFYITVKMVSEKLSDSNGFTIADRQDYLLTLVNFTDFAHLRLIIMAIQFSQYPAATYLRSNPDFIEVLTEVNLTLDLY